MRNNLPWCSKFTVKSMMSLNRFLRTITTAILLTATHSCFAFNHQHAEWEILLKRYVVVAQNGHSSLVDYAGLRQTPGALNAYLDSLSAVTDVECRRWTREERLAFLINAYNAFTVKLVLSGDPDLKSIKDLGSFLKSPWKKTFFTLLGAARSLDDVEHGLIRAPGVFDDPRIHFAVNCASIGCPMLRNEAYVAERLDAQLDDSARRFIGDRTRNRYDVASGLWSVSKIFDWYKSDFEKGYRGINSVQQFLSGYAHLLPEGVATDVALRQAQTSLRYLDYDWTLNALRSGEH